ncbi:hypothetical protein FRC0543_01910 [Corynebacterium diphtheriae]|nr:hypothetical protein FRC0376_01842 [Corynebacterium diphtheriae]CAB0914182.1 hypothetical protein FRC0409_01866 [Corynebacterium diphtheriae]CAB1044604.1 hypothetical protein FRC0544_01871 [Corynebacterium diphtheriae]CAB1045429.1 hypothetical protein FRC0543_01910 [Corynebacterium diphtheriae]
MQDFHGLTTTVLLYCEYRQRGIIYLTNVMELKSSICRWIKGSDTFSSSFQVGQTILSLNAQSMFLRTSLLGYAR